MAASLLVAGQLSFAHAVAEKPSAAQIPVVDSALAGEKQSQNNMILTSSRRLMDRVG